MACESYWVQCGDCQVWKKLAEPVPDTNEAWFCWMHPDPFISGCHHKSCNRNRGSDLDASKKLTFKRRTVIPEAGFDLDPYVESNCGGPALDSWMCCQECGRWRRVPSGAQSSDKENIYWCCAMHPDPQRRACRRSPLSYLKPSACNRRTPSFPSDAGVPGTVNTISLAGYLL